MKFADDTTFAFPFDLKSTQVNQVNGSGLPWGEPPIIIFFPAVHHAETHGMYSKDVRGGQRASLAFLWCPRPLWRCPPAPFTFEFLSRPNRSVVKYTLKKYEFMNFTQVYLSPSPYHQGETFPCSEGEVATCGEEKKKRGRGRMKQRHWHSVPTPALCCLELTSCKGGSMLILYKGHFLALVFLKEIRVDTLQHFQDPHLNNVFRTLFQQFVWHSLAKWMIRLKTSKGWLSSQYLYLVGIQSFQCKVQKSFKHVGFAAA